MGVMFQAPEAKFGDGKDIAANPGWRRAIALMVGVKSGTAKADGLRVIAPDMGTYINEGSVEDPTWRTSFWETNYARLSAIKTAMDPNMTFWVSPGINADRMHIVDGRAYLAGPAQIDTNELAPATERWHPVDMETDREFIFRSQEITGSGFPKPGEELDLQW